MSEFQDITLDSRPCILLVEDSKTAKAVLAKTLSENYTLIDSKDGEEAWDILQKDARIELVITDINMPRLTGQQLLVKIRKSSDPRITNIPVIVMTTTDDNVDKNLAFLNGANDFLHKPIDVMELQARVNVHHKLARTIRELEESKRALAEQATTDPLTRLKNRRAFHEEGPKILATVLQHKEDLSIIQLDVDHFKKVNDNYGHQAGDEVLIMVAELLNAIVRSHRKDRSGDILARMGGEEFSLLLPYTNRLGTAVMAERIRAAIEKEKLIIDGKSVSVTVSIGIASFASEHVESIRELLNIADRRMYLAKNLGRNRICVNDEGKSNFYK